MAQIPGLDQQDTLGFFVLVEDVVGLAHTLRSRLVWRQKNQMPLKMPFFLSLNGILYNMINEYLLKIVDVVVILDVNL